MKKLLFLLLMLPSAAWAQLGVSMHQSKLPFLGINYEIKEKLRPEFRLDIDTYTSDMSGELSIMYDFLNKEEIEIYGGVGVRGGDYSGFVVPMGMNIYPFETRKFGFQLEVAPIIGAYVLRGSMGIRYRFLKQ